MNGITTLPALAQKFHALVAELDVEPYYKLFHTDAQHDGSPHIEVSKGGFQFVITERGLELKRIANLSADGALYLLLEGITSHMATTYELKNRVTGIDSRSVWFPYQEDLMGSITPSWGERLRKKHRSILEDHPYST